MLLETGFFVFELIYYTRGKMEDIKTSLLDLKSRLDQMIVAIDLAEARKKLAHLEEESTRESFWENPEKAKKVLQEASSLREEIETIENLETELEGALELSVDRESEELLRESIGRMRKSLSKLELTAFLSGKYDKGDAILALHAGQGGTEAQDWVSMLLRMYLRYSEKREWKTEVVDETPGEEAGIKSITLLVKGPYSYGYLKGEAGTHRLVRQSPFNADNLRQTSFALVEVLPFFEESPEIEIREDDLDWQFTHSSGHGGQNVQKVATAVRLKHLPTGIVVAAQAQRYQEANRKIALNLLRAKLWEKKEEELKKEKSVLRGTHRQASWGGQIRSYILHPYKMVKDLRTSVESTDPEKVLAGEIDEFIEAELRSNFSGY